VNRFALLSMTGFCALIFIASFFEASGWSSFPNYLSAMASIVTMIIAGAALQSWKEQIAFKQRHHIAIEVIENLDKIRRGCHHAREPGPMNAKDMDFLESYKENHHSGYTRLPEFRMREMIPTLNRVKSMSWNIEWSLGPDARKAVEKYLDQCEDFHRDCICAKLYDDRRNHDGLSPQQRLEIEKDIQYLDDRIHGLSREAGGRWIDAGFHMILNSLSEYLPPKR